MTSLKIDKRESFGSTDSWTEYLVISRENKDNFNLSIKVHIHIDNKYESLYIDKYLDDSGYNLPKIINGLEVKGWEGDALVSSDLEDSYEYDKLRFNSKNYNNKAWEWLDLVGWVINDKQFSKIHDFMKL